MRKYIYTLLLGMAVVTTWVSGASVVRHARIFRIAHLTSPPVEAGYPRLPLGGLLTESWDSEYGAGGVRGGGFGFAEKTGGGAIDLAPLYSAYLEREHLSDLIRTFIHEDSWANKRNDIIATGSKLTVVQSDAALQEIEAMLRSLYARRMRQVDIAVAVLPHAVFEQLAKEAELEAGAFLMAGAFFDRAVAKAGDTGTCWRRTADEGEACGFNPLFRRMSLKDYDVNQTGVAPVVNPLIGIWRAGLAANVRCARTVMNGHFLLDYRIAKVGVGSDRHVRKMPLGDLELPELDGVSLSGSILAPEGKTLVLGRFSWSREKPASLVALARVNKVPQPVLPAAAFEIIDVGSLLRPWFLKHHLSGGRMDAGFHNNVTVRESYQADEKPLFTPATLIKRARAVLPQDLQNHPRLKMKLAGSGLFIAVSGDRDATARGASIIRAHFGLCFQRKARTLTAHVRMGTVAAEALEGIKDRQKGTVLLVPDWRSRAALERETLVRVAGLPNKVTTIYAGILKRYIMDAEHVSGGTGANIVEIADPVVTEAGTGFMLYVRIKPVSGTQWVQVHVDGEVAETSFKEKTSVYADRALKSGGPYGVQASGQKLTIDLPQQKADQWKHVVTMPVGRACLLNAFPDPKEPSKMRILVVEPDLLK